MINFAKTVALSVALLLGSAAQAAVLQDGGFETQGGALGKGYCYFKGNFAAACATGAWTGGGETSGLMSSGNTDWPARATNDGSRYAFIQSGYGQAGSISQNFTVSNGYYALSWLAAGRPTFGGDQNYTVTLTGTNGTQTLYNGITKVNQGFTQISSGNPFLLDAGNYTLTFQALNGASDSTAFIDGVSFAASVPEPATWGLMILGFGAVGYSMRRKVDKRTVSYS